MHKIKNASIRPELRAWGVLIRTLVPAFTPWMFRAAKKMIRVMKGKCGKGLRYEQHFVPREDGRELRLCVYAPLEARENVPGILWIHGGGYAIGAPEQDEVFIRRFVEVSGCVVVSPDYCLSIDQPYPAALRDCYAALEWLRAHGAEYGMRDDQIMVGGDSAGGGLAAAIALYARDRGEIALAFQMPLYPMLDDRMNTASSTDNDAPVWNSKSNDTAWRLYLGALFGGAEVPAYAAPARATDVSGLPPAVSFVGGIEPFRDEAIAYFDRMKAAGVPVRFKVYEGCFHAFDIVGSKTAVAREATAFLMDAFAYAVEHYFAKQPE